MQLLPESSEGFELVEVDQDFKTLSLSKEEVRRLGFGYKDVNLALLLSCLAQCGKAGSRLASFILHINSYRLLWEDQLAFEAPTVFEHSFELSDIPDTAFFCFASEAPCSPVISGSLWPDENDGFYEDKNLRELKDSSSPLTCFNLVVSAVRVENLCHILRAPKALEIFYYMITLYEDRTSIEIRHALGLRENSLERLGFDHDREYFALDEKAQVAYGVAAGHNPFFGPMASFISGL